MPRLFLPLSTLVMCLSAVGHAAALQPLSEFVGHAKTHNFDAREARLLSQQRQDEAATQGRKLLPVITARGVYTHNQYEAVAKTPLGEAIITPQDQLDAFFSVDVPIIDVGQWERHAASNRLHDAARARESANVLDIEQSVTRIYYDVLATRGVLDAAEKTLEASESDRKVIEKRHAAGLATDLDLARTVAETERNKQAIAAARYNMAVKERQLATNAGIVPESSGALQADDLHAEAPLSAFLEGASDETPSLLASRLEAESADKTASAQWFALAPTLAANATERLTNATGFSGRTASYQLSATLTWKLDASVASQASALNSAKAIAVVHREKAEALHSDAIHDAYDLVLAQIQNSRAARAESDANGAALKFATERYNAGTALQSDVLDASHNLFSSQVARVQADADLAYARASLRIVSARTSSKAKANP